MDIKWAFLHGKIDEVVYIQQPRGYKAPGPNDEHLVGRLNSSLYGIKQVAHMFYHTLREELESLGFVHCAVDHAVFIYRKGGMRCLTGWHVDDAMGGSNNESFLREVKHKLHMWFGITDMGAIAKFLGIQFEQNRETRELWIHQTEYIHHLLKGMVFLIATRCICLWTRITLSSRTRMQPSSFPSIICPPLIPKSLANSFISLCALAWILLTQFNVCLNLYLAQHLVSTLRPNTFCISWLVH